MVHKYRSMLGVTLLEIMLVLAIAGMIIVMSVRYYQAASISNQTNVLVSQVLAIVAAEESISQSGGGYVNTAGLAPLLPTNAFSAPWGGAMTVTPGTNGFTISVPNIPGGQTGGICTNLNARFTTTNGRITINAGCTTITYT